MDGQQLGLPGTKVFGPPYRSNTVHLTFTSGSVLAWIFLGFFYQSHGSVMSDRSIFSDQAFAGWSQAMYAGICQTCGELLAVSGRKMEMGRRHGDIEKKNLGRV